MAFVDAAVNLARVMVAVLAMSLMPPVWTSVALRANVFMAAVLTLADAFRATVFEAAVWTPGRNFTHFAPRQPASRNVDKEDRKTCRELIGRGERKCYPF